MQEQATKPVTIQCIDCCRPTIGGAGSSATDVHTPGSPAIGAGGSKAPADDVVTASVDTNVLHSRPPPPAFSAAYQQPAAAAATAKSVPSAAHLSSKPRLVEIQRREGESLGINIVGGCQHCRWVLVGGCLQCR